VKATVDAYDGTVTLYAWDESDPMLQTWMKAFPDVVKARTEISPALMEHLRYPEDLFKVQRFQFARYHVTDAGDWYEFNDRWQVPTDPNAAGKQQPPYRVFVETPGSEEQVFSLTSVYVPYGRDNLTSFVTVDSDATSENYGKFHVLTLGNENTRGPSQIANEFASDPKVRDELLGFNQGGTKPIYGNLLTLPVGDGLMYVQPLYALREAAGSYPNLRFVLTYYAGQVGIGDSLEDSIADILGTSISPPPTTPPDDTPLTGSLPERVRTLLQQANALFQKAEDAQRRGDTVAWAENLSRAQAKVEAAVKAFQQQPATGKP